MTMLWFYLIVFGFCFFAAGIGVEGKEGMLVWGLISMGLGWVIVTGRQK